MIINSLKERVFRSDYQPIMYNEVTQLAKGIIISAGRHAVLSPALQALTSQFRWQKKQKLSVNRALQPKRLTTVALFRSTLPHFSTFTSRNDVIIAFPPRIEPIEVWMCLMKTFSHLHNSTVEQILALLNFFLSSLVPALLILSYQHLFSTCQN